MKRIVTYSKDCQEFTEIVDNLNEIPQYVKFIKIAYTRDENIGSVPVPHFEGYFINTETRIVRHESGNEVKTRKSGKNKAFVKLYRNGNYHIVTINSIIRWLCNPDISSN